MKNKSIAPNLLKKNNQKIAQKIDYNPLFSDWSSYIQKASWSGATFPSITKAKGVKGFCYVLGSGQSKALTQILQKMGPRWQQDVLKGLSEREVIHFSGNQGPVWIWHRQSKKGNSSHFGRLEDSDYTWYRDQVGAVLGFSKAYQVKNLFFEFIGTEESQELGALVGLDLAAYNYKQVCENKALDGLPLLFISKSINKKAEKFNRSLANEAQARARATNWARHLVNTPPNFLNPVSMSQWSKKYLADLPGLNVKIWDQDRLKKENMGLHLAVGQGSQNPPCMIHIQYTPVNSKNLKARKPIALVGKGVTFDTGGLDIKPSSNMRLMKKDMGGAASLAGLAMWLSASQYSRPVDIYLGLAENSVDSKSFRPSDVIVARNGMKVEIHNTDAEGRLVLADVLDVAVEPTGDRSPDVVINVATLTGAIKAGLGADIAGLFSNHDELAEELNLAGAQTGDINWRMPLFNKYTHNFSSNFADIVNATDGFGGAITAALFLEKFVKGKPWAHLDIYAWNDKPTGALSFTGGSGQPVQCLIQFLKMRESV
jgi:leucyl aminopeptidase